MAATQKKICMLGAFAVGKTSLVQRFVDGLFSEKYLTTVGVKIDRKVVAVEARGDVNLILWDLQGEDDFNNLRATYLRGASGHLIVADGTRGATLETAIRLRDLAAEMTPGAPCLLVVNKSDLRSSWEIDDKQLSALSEDGWCWLTTSALNAEGVEAAFEKIAAMVTQ